MTEFTSRPVLSEYKTIGDQLRLARAEKGYSIKQAAAHLKVRPEYLSALEEEDYQKIPGGFYGKIFLKRYVHFLGLDYKSLVKHFIKERRALYHDEPDVFSKKVVKKSSLIIFPKIFRNALVALIIVICLFYIGFYLKNITAPPVLDIESPPANSVQKDFSAVIKGRTEPESEVYVNGQMILIDKEGKFSQNISLKQGVNIIVISAKKKYSREQIVTRQILVE
jgi:cytoskeletal protein RodZ